MRKVVDGLVYNTETAKFVAEYESSCNCGDFRWYAETLYCTVSGRFFVAGEGGPMSPWRASTGNGWTNGCGMRALSPNEALRWCEERDIEVEAVTRHFDLPDA